MERPKNKNISRCRVVSFQNETERHKVLVRGNDRNAVGTTLSVWGRSTERLRRKVERWVTSGPSGPRSCRSDLVPRSRVVPNRSRRKGCFGTTPERSRNEEGGWAKVGVFPLYSTPLHSHSPFPLFLLLYFPTHPPLCFYFPPTSEFVFLCEPT